MVCVALECALLGCAVQMPSGWSPECRDGGFTELYALRACTHGEPWSAFQVP